MDEVSLNSESGVTYMYVTLALSAAVCTVINDPAHPQRTEMATDLVNLLEWASIALVIAISLLTTVIDGRVWILVRNTEDDYKARLITERQAALADEAAALAKNLDDVRTRVEKRNTEVQARKNHLYASGKDVRGLVDHIDP